MKKNTGATDMQEIETKDWTRKFEWDSGDQKQGYLSFLKWAKDKGVTNTVRPIDLFFIQKDLDSSAWWREMLSGQVTALRGEIEHFQRQLVELRREITEEKAKLRKRRRWWGR